MSIKARHAFYLFIGVGSLFIVWPCAFQWMQNGGNILNPWTFFLDVWKLGGAPAFLTADIAIAWLTFMVWVVGDAKRIGLGAKWGWGFVALSYLGTCFAFPVYLVVRERHLERAGTLTRA